MNKECHSGSFLMMLQCGKQAYKILRSITTPFSKVILFFPVKLFCSGCSLHPIGLLNFSKWSLIWWIKNKRELRFLPIKYNLFPRDTTVLFFHCCDFSILKGRKASQTKQNIPELGSLTYCFVVEQNPSSGISFSDIKPAFIRDRYYRCMRNKVPNAQLRHSLYFNTKLSYPFWSIQWQMWPTNEIWKIEPLFVKADFIMCLSLNFKKIDRN